MNHELLRNLMDVFSSENQKLRDEISDLKRQLAKHKNSADDELLKAVFKDEPKPKVIKRVKVPVEGKTETPPVTPIEEAPKSEPAPVLEMPKKGRPKTSTVDRVEYQKKYQAEYRAKKKLEKQKCGEEAKQNSTA